MYYLDYDPGLILTYFTPSSNLDTQAFAWAKVKIMNYFETIAAIGLIVVFVYSNEWINEDKWVSKVNVIIRPSPKVTQI